MTESDNVLRQFISTARWFGGKGRDWSLTSVRRVGRLPGSPPGLEVSIDLAEVTYSPTASEQETDTEVESELYQLPLAFYTEQQERLSHALIGEWEDPELGKRFVYDALHDREAMGLWLQAFADADVDHSDAGPTQLTFHRMPGHEFDLEVHSTLFSGEQSNSSVLFGEDSLMKVFRRVTPGTNPDIATHRVLTEAGSDHVAALYGWLDLVDDETGEVVQLAMLQQFLRTASDGWELALTSVRNLFVEADLHADEVGGDFAGEASRLGTALREVHESLRESFPTETRDAAALDELASAMESRLEAAGAVVPELAEHADKLRATYARLRELPGITVQQVHGDLHLGQTLRTARGWKIVDFEGEPAKPLADRLLPDSPWRDVAGMLRSFDYAPQVVAMTSFATDIPNEAEQQAYRAAEWAQRNRSVFLTAYVEGRDLDETESLLLAAYVADKAVYEAVYEARNRPAWLGIPLAALARTEAS